MSILSFIITSISNGAAIPGKHRNYSNIPQKSKFLKKQVIPQISDDLIRTFIDGQD